MTKSPRSWRILIAVGSLLTLGAAGGVAMDRATQLHGPGGVLGRLHEDPVGYLDSVVGLRPEQRKNVEAILAARQSEVDTAWLEAHARILATMHSVIEEIMAELDPEQVELFHQMIIETHGPGHVPPFEHGPDHDAAHPMGHGASHVPPAAGNGP